MGEARSGEILGVDKIDVTVGAALRGRPSVEQVIEDVERGGHGGPPLRSVSVIELAKTYAPLGERTHA